MSVKVTIEFSTNPNFGTIKDTGNKVMMMQDKIKSVGKGDEVKVVVKRVLERNKFDVTVADQLVHSLVRDGQVDAGKLATILEIVGNELENAK